MAPSLIGLFVRGIGLGATNIIAITVSLSANVTSASAHTLLFPFAALIMLQLLVLAAA